MSTLKKPVEAVKLDFDSSICESPMSMLSSSLSVLTTDSVKKLTKRRLPWDVPVTPENDSLFKSRLDFSVSPNADSPMLQRRVLKNKMRGKELLLEPSSTMNKDKENINRTKVPFSFKFSEDSQDSGYSGGSASQDSFDEALISSSTQNSLTEFEIENNFLMDEDAVTQNSFDIFLNSKIMESEKHFLSPNTELMDERVKLGQIRKNTSTLQKDLKVTFKRPITLTPSEKQGGSEMKKGRFLMKSTSMSDIDFRHPRSPLKQNSINLCPIKEALNKSSEDQTLIGDFSKTHSLATLRGKHQDLQSISSDTLAELIKGKHKEKVKKYFVLDCRYPYEFEGGHIKGALNLYTKEGILERFFKYKIEPHEDSTSTVLIFHCEFSSERAPALYRFLRNNDREHNQYPKLNYPEIYLLEGGYKQFYASYKECCQPQSYLPMLHQDHEKDLKKFRAKSKSWAGGEKSVRPAKRIAPGLKF